MSIATEINVVVGGEIFSYPLLHYVPHCRLMDERDMPGLPDWIAVIDTRCPGASVTPQADYGEHLWSSEKPAYAFGLRSDFGLSNRHDFKPRSIQVYCDLRTHPDDFRALVKSLTQAAEQERERYLAGTQHLPVFICVSNYGGSVICDRRVQHELSQARP